MIKEPDLSLYFGGGKKPAPIKRHAVEGVRRFLLAVVEQMKEDLQSVIGHL